MNTTEAVMERLDYTREGGRYFAFVESIDALNEDALKDRGGLPDYWFDILGERDVSSLGPPTHRIWLDCVREDYFSGLDWRTEPCQRNNADDAIRRRKQLLDMDAKQFATVFLLMNDADGKDALEQFQEGSWHEIRLDLLHGLPVVAAADFDLIAAQRCYMQWRSNVTERDARLLLNVFNLDFLHDVDWGEKGSTPPQPLGGPTPWEDIGSAYPNYQTL